MKQNSTESTSSKMKDNTEMSSRVRYEQTRKLGSSHKKDPSSTDLAKAAGYYLILFIAGIMGFLILCSDKIAEFFK